MGENEIPTEDLVEDLKRVDEKVDGILLARDYKEHGNYSIETVRSRSTWKGMLKEADIKSEYSREEMIEELQKLNEEIDGEVYVKNFEQMSDIRIYSVKKEFGGWKKAKEEADIIEEVDKEEMIADVQNCAEQVDGNLTFDEYRSIGKYTDVEIKNNFETWNKFKEEAGLDLDLRSKGILENYREEIIEMLEGRRSIKEIAEKLDLSYSYLTKILKESDIETRNKLSNVNNTGAILSLNTDELEKLDIDLQKEEIFYSKKIEDGKIVIELSENRVKVD